MHIGGVEYEVRELRSLIDRKADKHEFHQVNSDVDRLERTVRELLAEVDGLRSELSMLKDSLRQAVA